MSGDSNPDQQDEPTDHGDGQVGIGELLDKFDASADEGLTQLRQEVVGDETITAEKLNLWASEIRQYNESIERRLDRHSLLDPPEDRENVVSDNGVMESTDYTITFDETGAADGDDEEGDSDTEEWTVERPNG